MQLIRGLSGRQVAEVVRCRIDFTYSLAMELDDPGFHHSVLADFRERLTHDGRADRLLDLALTRLKEAGLVRERTTRRTYSTHVLAAVRDVTRLELVTEAVRAAVEEATRPLSRHERRPGVARHPYSPGASRSPMWRAPSTSSPTDTACVTAATEDSGKPTCNTCSRPGRSPGETSAVDLDHPKIPDRIKQAEVEPSRPS
ncbi:transposase [Streptomyces sp. NPDC057743]|uniref:transposase n=1 Tax=Streptomyces sp. NPDC057743 TaxID=3346236 RepID=UPI0036A8793C